MFCLLRCLQRYIKQVSDYDNKPKWHKMFSERCTNVYLKTSDFLMTNFAKASADPFDSVTNPKGFVNLGTCVNALLEEELEDVKSLIEA